MSDAEQVPAVVYPRPLTVLAPPTTVGIVLVSWNDEGGLDAHWMDAAEVVPPDREFLARALRMLADALELPAPAGGD